MEFSTSSLTVMMVPSLHESMDTRPRTHARQHESSGQVPQTMKISLMAAHTELAVWGKLKKLEKDRTDKQYMTR